MPRLDDYEPIVGKQVINQIRKDAQPLIGKHIVHVNSTSNGGGVAEILNSMLPLMNDLGIRAGWRVLKGNYDFFVITKSFHNSLQGETIKLNPRKKRIYEQVNKDFASFTHLHHDCVIIHDPQPLPLIRSYRKVQPWIWRCHIDLSHPDKDLWQYMQPFISKYDRWIISHKDFAKDNGVPHTIIMPSIDPLSEKNRDMSETEQLRILKKHGVPLDKPIIAQVSRFDKWKDPIGVIESYKLVKKQADCRLILLGSAAADDPEGSEILKQVLDAAKVDPDIFVINFESDRLVNALQRKAAVIIQKSLREGFGLTVSEALWKGTPVVATKVGGIPLQVQSGKNGYLVTSEKTCANAIIKLLSDKRLRARLGKAGKQTVKEKFLITRHLHDYVKLLNSTLITYKT